MVQLRYERLTSWRESIVSTTEHDTNSDHNSSIDRFSSLGRDPNHIHFSGLINRNSEANENRVSSKNLAINRVSSFVSIEFDNRQSVREALNQVQQSNNALLSSLADPTQIGILSTLT